MAPRGERSLDVATGEHDARRWRRLVSVALAGSIIAALPGAASAQADRNPPPRLVSKDGRHALIVDGKPFFMLGAQCHNSSAWPAMLPGVWRAVASLHANTLEVPIYWEQIEPQPGKFDFSLVDVLLEQARQRRVRLVLLWFASWKNGSNHYVPEWMKRDSQRYPNIVGRNGQAVDSPSPHTQAAMEADARAFAAVMAHLRTSDPQHTVLMVQVQNEPGSWGSVRDYSPTAQKLFEGAVPAELLAPEVLRALNRPVGARGTWLEVFADDADEYFHAWSVARYIQHVAAAGKAVNPLPLYVNAALRDPLSNPRPSSYESGGPTDNVIPIWKAAAPAIDLLAPDIYLAGSDRVLKVLELYGRPDNPLLVPEIGASPENARYLYSVLARGGIGFAPFGVDNSEQGGAEDAANDARLAPLAQEYAAAAPMMPELARWGFEGKLKAAVEREDHGEQTIDLGAWQMVVTFGASRGRRTQANTEPVGRLLVAKLGESEFVVVGTLAHITFRPAGSSAGKDWQFLKVEEGRYENGAFLPSRVRNGDETDWGGPRFGPVPAVLRITLVAR
jgi:hypothetical protein